jgi:hypothetical protein
MPDSAGRNRWREEVVHEPAIHSYALRTDEQAVSHLQFASGDVDLRRSYLAILAAIEAHLETGVMLLMGVMDDVKVRSLFGLFERVAACVGDDELRVKRVKCARALARKGHGATSCAALRRDALHCLRIVACSRSSARADERCRRSPPHCSLCCVCAQGRT